MEGRTTFVTLGTDIDGEIIYEGYVCRAPFSSLFDIETMPDSDPRLYCALQAADGRGYAISVYDHWYSKLIRKREGISSDEDIPILIRPIGDMTNYEIGYYGENGNILEYEFDLEKLRDLLNRALGFKTKGRTRKKTIQFKMINL